jgi:hypothetical protein
VKASYGVSNLVVARRREFRGTIHLWAWCVSSFAGRYSISTNPQQDCGLRIEAARPRLVLSGGSGPVE